MLLSDFHCKENDGTISFLDRTLHLGIVTSDYGGHEVFIVNIYYDLEKLYFNNKRS